jgi:hypothetical protein
MRKQELVHLHGLLVELTQFVVDQGVVSAEVWRAYDALDIHAHSIQAQKGDHEDAVLLLAAALATTLEQPTGAQSAASVH